MNNSIHHLIENGIPKIEKGAEIFSKNPKDHASMIYLIRDVFMEAAAMMVGEIFSAVNDEYRNSPSRAAGWVVVKHDKKKLTTSIGDTVYEKTLFMNKDTKERRYLADDTLGFDKHTRFTDDALAAMIEEAEQTSYRRGGLAASLTTDASKGTVKNILHGLEFPTENESEAPKEKRVVKQLFIEADEDHISLQFQEKKGDLKRSKNGRKLNGAMEKLVYVHEGIRPVAPQSKRHELINPHYFSGSYEGEKNKDLWDEVYTYIDNNYDIDRIEKIYLNSDGGEWIKAGIRRLHGVKHVMDEYHLRNKVVEMTRHVDDAENGDYTAMNALLETIRSDTKDDFRSYVDMLLFNAKDDVTWQRISRNADYILNNWMAAKVRLAYHDRVCGSSTEGHVYHLLSSRMSTLAMGWSRHGANIMAHLRAYMWNGGSGLELVKYQKKKRKLKMAAGAEKDVLSAGDMFRSEHFYKSVEAKYYDVIQAKLEIPMRKHLCIVLGAYL